MTRMGMSLSGRKKRNGVPSKIELHGGNMSASITVNGKPEDVQAFLEKMQLSMKENDALSVAGSWNDDVASLFAGESVCSAKESEDIRDKSSKILQVGASKESMAEIGNNRSRNNHESGSPPNAKTREEEATKLVSNIVEKEVKEDTVHEEGYHCVHPLVNQSVFNTFNGFFEGVKMATGVEQLADSNNPIYMCNGDNTKKLIEATNCAGESNQSMLDSLNGLFEGVKSATWVQQSSACISPELVPNFLFDCSTGFEKPVPAVRPVENNALEGDGRDDTAVEITPDMIIPKEARQGMDSTETREEVPSGDLGSKKWKAVWDKNRCKYYYYNRYTMESTWEKPVEFDNIRLLADGTDQFWKAKVDLETNKTYYYNKERNEVSWDKPHGALVQ